MKNKEKATSFKSIIISLSLVSTIVNDSISCISTLSIDVINLLRTIIKNLQFLKLLKN